MTYGRVIYGFAVSLLLVSNCSEAFALAVSTKDPGKVACYIWCNEHNKTDRSIIQCENQCEKYYGPSKISDVPMAIRPKPAPPPSTSPIGPHPIVRGRLSRPP